MLELLALTPDDGWAYIRCDNQIRLIRPPYTKASSAVVSEASVEAAVTKHGFIVPPAEQSQFADYSALIGFLEASVAASDTGLNDDAGQGLLQYLPLESLERFLDRIEQDLLPNRKWDHAEKLLLNMLLLPMFNEQVALRDRAIRRLKQISVGRAAEKDERRTQAAEDLLFPTVFTRAAATYGKPRVDELTARIQNRGTVFPF